MVVQLQLLCCFSFIGWLVRRMVVGCDYLVGRGSFVVHSFASLGRDNFVGQLPARLGGFWLVGFLVCSLAEQSTSYQGSYLHYPARPHCGDKTLGTRFLIGLLGKLLTGVSKVEPCDPFMLMANSVQEVNFLLNPSTSGSKQIYVNVVGIL